MLFRIGVGIGLLLMSLGMLGVVNVSPVVIGIALLFGSIGLIAGI